MDTEKLIQNIFVFIISLSVLLFCFIKLFHLEPNENREVYISCISCILGLYMPQAFTQKKKTNPITNIPLNTVEEV